MSSNELLDQLRTLAGQVLSGDALDSFITYAPLDAYTTPDGEINEEKVMGHLTALHAARMSEPPQWGQGSGPPGPPMQPGDRAREALKRRHGVSHDGGPSASSHISSGGATARAALARRHGIQ